MVSTENRTDIIIRANKAIVDRLGITVQETKDLTCYRCVHGTDEPPGFCLHSRLLKDGREHMAEVRDGNRERQK